MKKTLAYALALGLCGCVYRLPQPRTQPMTGAPSGQAAPSGPAASGAPGEGPSQESGAPSQESGAPSEEASSSAPVEVADTSDCDSITSNDDLENLCKGGDSCDSITDNDDLENLCKGGGSCDSITDNDDMENLCKGVDSCDSITDNDDLENLCKGGTAPGEANARPQSDFWSNSRPVERFLDRNGRSERFSVVTAAGRS
jgi:hypothetical protein